MIEKFSDYEGTGFIDKEGTFEFEVMRGELKQSQAGNPMVVLDVKSSEGSSTLYHSLNPKARWSYNNLIKACLGLDTREKIESFECDYETIHNKLIGKKFMGVVECQSYTKVVKKPQDDGTFADVEEVRDSYKIVSYDFA